MVYTKLSQISGGNSAGAAKTFVFLDMREDRVNWGNFMTHMAGALENDPSQYMFTEDLPGMYHNLACGFSFADGHSEIKRWRDPRTTPPLLRGTEGPAWEISSPGNADVAWLQDHTSRPK